MKKYIPMKRGFTILVSMMALVLASCSTESQVESGGGDSLTLRLDVEEITTATRANIPAETGETTINSLYLLFYNNTSDGSGTLAATISHADLASQMLDMNSSYQIPYADFGLDADAAYNILALANVAPSGAMNGFLGDEAAGEFLGRFAGMTERQAIETASLAVLGVDADQEDDSEAISPANLVMSARVVKQRNDETIIVKLTRGVARVDVSLAASVESQYELVSASIWGAATSTSVWGESITQFPEHMRRFYGLKEGDDIIGGATITRGLYTFENFVANPGPNDQVTTCLILGFKPKTAMGDILYYRANISNSQASQNLVRNHVYKMKVNSVSGDGATNEYNAWSNSATVLDITLGDWGYPDNGNVITDGTNTMILPTKVIRLNSDGDVREYSIFTIGEHSLSISKRSLPQSGGEDMFTVELIGNMLRVSADELPASFDEIKGSIEIAFGPLRGTVTIIQSPSNDMFLELNRYDVPNHSPVGRGGTADNLPFMVSASGDWTATLYNMSEDTVNPGFSFNPSGMPVTLLRSANNPFADMFQVYTTGDNPSNSDIRRGFVIVTLDEDPENFNRLIVLGQDPKTEIVVSPAFPDELHFSPVGIPVGVSGATAQNGFEFDVDPGMINGAYNVWTATVAGPQAQYFDVETVTAGSIQKVKVRAKGSTNPAAYPFNENPHFNLTSGELKAELQIMVSESVLTVDLVHEAMGLSLSTRGLQVPVGGGRVGDITVNINPNLHWAAQITTNYNVQSDFPGITTPHQGYLALNGTRVPGSLITGQDMNQRLSAGFDKIYYPLIGKSPRMKIKVWLVENPDIYTEITVTQDPLVARPMNIYDARNTSFGCLTGGDHYLRYYREYLNSSTLYGTNGRYVKTAGRVSIYGQGSDPASIPSTYAYVHAGGQPSEWTQARHSAVNDWWESYGRERLLVYDADTRNDRIFAGSTSSSRKKTVLSMLGIQYDDTSGSPRLRNNLGGNPVYEYITGDGPAGAVSTGVISNFYWDTTSTGVLASSLPDTAVPIIWDGDSAVMMFIDPANNLVYWGESQLFDIWYDSLSDVEANRLGNDSDGNRTKLLINIQSWMLNAAQYGSHFTDLFLENNESLYEDAFDTQL